MKPRKLIDRFDLGEVPSRGIWFILEGTDISILNVGKLMSSAPFDWSGMFNGWEALLENGEIIREENLEDLLNELTLPLNREGRR